jgi:maltooligosyltrehalose synthase
VNKQTLAKAVKEAKRFLDAAELARAEAGDDPTGNAMGLSRYCGACKRASMDLSRALAELRKPS